MDGYEQQPILMSIRVRNMLILQRYFGRWLAMPWSVTYKAQTAQGLKPRNSGPLAKRYKGTNFSGGTEGGRYLDQGIP